MIHLDSNFLIDAFVPGTAQETQFRQWIATAAALNLSAVAWGEFLCGPLTPAAENLARTLFPVPESFVASDAELAATLFNVGGRRTRSFADCCIAAVAIRCGAGLATSNRGDFAPFAAQGLIFA